jgi:hypothetical protein
MYMDRIEVPVEAATPSKPRMLKLAVGASFLTLALLLVAPWLCLVVAWFALAAGARAMAKVGATIRDTLIYAGELVVGR